MFTKDSKLVRDYALLIQNGIKTLEDVPSFMNLKEVVQSVLNIKNDTTNDKGDVQDEIYSEE